MSVVVYQPLIAPKVEDIEFTSKYSHGKILFRGDSRNAFTVFKNGFGRTLDRPDFDVDKYPLDGTPQPVVQKELKKILKAQEGDGKPRVIYRYFTDNGINVQAGDILPVTAVCLTGRISIAPMFPLEEKEQFTNIFVCYVQTKDLVNTHAVQAVTALKGMDSIKYVSEKFAKVAFTETYAYEMCTERVPPQQIICAIKCKRTYNAAPDWDAGCSYSLHTVNRNTNCNVPEDMKQAALKWVDEETTKHGKGDSPDWMASSKKSEGKGDKGKKGGFKDFSFF